MSAARQYSVVTTGTIQPGFDENQVAADFATLLCSPLEVAQTFINAKKCVAADLDEDRAQIYQESLTEIGLQVIVIPSDGSDAANEMQSEPASEAHPDVDVSPEYVAAATPVSEFPAPESIAVSESLRTDERDFYPPSDKQSDVVDLRPPRSAVIDLPPPETYDLDKDTGRVFRLATLAVIAAVLAGSLYITREQVTSTISGLSGQTTHAKTDLASDDITTLLEISGLNSQFVSFTQSVPSAFDEFFEPLVEDDPSVTKTDVSRLMRLIPKAYNAEALQISAGNRLNRMTYASDIVGLIEIYEDPAIQGYIERADRRNIENNRSDFDRFKNSLVDKPLSRARRTALTGIIDSMGLDSAKLDIERDLMRNLIATAGELRPDSETPEAKERVQQEIKLMREAMNAQSNAIRVELIEQLAWQYEHADLVELHQLRDATNRSMVRSLIRETTISYETFMRDATLWLHRELDDK